MIHYPNASAFGCLDNDNRSGLLELEQLLWWVAKVLIL
jgi:hypothetical protein